MTTNVVTVEDDARYRESLERLLERTDEFAAVGSFPSAESALEHLERMASDGRRVSWDLVLMDLELPGISGIEAIPRVKDHRPEATVVVLTVFEEHRTVLRAICAGADGYLTKRLSSSEILEELRSVLSGGAPLSGGVARTVLDLLRRRAGEPAGRGDADGPSRLDLTDRERDVLRSFVDGNSYAGVASELGISENTVRTHVRSIYSKLQVQNVAEAVTRAIREGLV